MEFSDNDISEFLSDLIELGGVNTVDRDSGKIIRSALSHDPCTINNGTTNTNLAVYGSTAKNVTIVNPFADGELSNEQSLWFYSTRNTILSGMLAKAVVTVLTIAATANEGESKKKKKDQAEVDITDTRASKFLGKFALLVDNKMVEEFKTVSSDLTDFAKIYYNKSKRRAEFRCTLFNESTKTIYKNKVRVGSWEPLQNIVLKVLQVEDLGELVTEVKILDMPTFDTMCRLYVDIVDRLAKPLTIAEMIVDTTSVKARLDKLEPFYAKAKWCVSSTNVINKPTTSAAPWGGPAPATAGPAPASPNAGFNRPFAAPVAGPAPATPNAMPFTPAPAFGGYGPAPFAPMNMGMPVAGPAPAVPNPVPFGMNQGYNQNYGQCFTQPMMAPQPQPDFNNSGNPFY